MFRYRACQLIGLTTAVCIGGCAAPPSAGPDMAPAAVSPTTQPAFGEPLALEPSLIEPMYREKLPIDLPTALRVAAAQNIDILQAREQVNASRGRLESTVGGALPALVPTALFEHVDGTVRATQGDLVGVGFTTFQPALAVQWVINPGRVVYDIVAARKRLLAVEQQERGVIQQTLHRAASQYHDLVLAQAQVSVAVQAVSEAEELLRINRARLQVGTGVPADEHRAIARLAGTRQQLVEATRAFYDASVSLAVTLRLDATATLVPGIEALPPLLLVREDLTIDDLLGLAVAHRPDLASVRTLVEAAAAEKDAAWWAGFGPEFQVGYAYSGITGHANNTKARDGIPGNLIVNPLSATGSFAGNPVANGLIKEGIARGSDRLTPDEDETFGFSGRQRVDAGASWRLSLAVFGELKAASARQRQAALEGERQLERVRADVVRAAQAAKANRQLIDMAHQQLAAAQETLRLSQANLEVGTMTTLEVLQAQDAAAEARLQVARAVVRFNQAQIDLLASMGLIHVMMEGSS